MKFNESPNDMIPSMIQ